MATFNFEHISICPEGYYEAIRTEKGKVDTVWILLSEQSIPKNKTSATLLGVKTVGSQEVMTFKADFGTFLAKQKFVPSPVVGDDDEEDYVTHLNPVTVLCDECKLIEDSEEPALKRPKNKFKSKKSKQKSKKKSKSKTSLKCKKTPYAWKSSSIKKSPFRTLKRAKDAESKYKDGQSIGFTAISSLKSLGRIPRSDGCYVLGAKYSTLKSH
jgi:hypothetical protein